MTWTQIGLVVAYELFFAASLGAMLWWHRRQRKTRLPFADDLRLLRGPGESQRRIVQKFEEDLFVYLFGAGLIPPLVSGGLLLVAVKLPRPLVLPGAVIAVLSFIALFLLATRWISGKTIEQSNRYLGYFGERIVAEELEPLKRQGWFVIHDLPGRAHGADFNIDHVAVGPPGVFVIETKTRRKGRARPGFADYKVYFDGTDLVWPWGEDNHGLDQAERNAKWLAEVIREDTGERVPVIPILTLPGWWVERKPGRDSRPATVRNPKVLATDLAGGPMVITEASIKAIAAKLSSRCRDVEY